MATVAKTAVIISTVISMEIYKIFIIITITRIIMITVTRIIVATMTITIAITITTVIVATSIMAVIIVVIARSQPIFSLYISVAFTLLNEEYSLKTLWMHFNKHSLFDLKIHSYFPACPFSTVKLTY